jgi:hypothetical protein
VGQYLASSDVRKRFAEPLAELASEFEKLCRRWERTRKARKIARPDLLLNDSLPQAAIGTLRKLLREASGKLDDAIAGVYRYRRTETRGGRRTGAAK